MKDRGLEGRASLMLVHGAGSGPWVFEGWADAFPGLTVVTVDLHDGLDIPCASMHDYARSLIKAATELPTPLFVCGWSMGGLVALMASATLEPAGLILLEPSPPAGVQGFDASQELRQGAFDPQEVYGPFPADIQSRLESQLARDERKRGISVPRISRPCLVVWGDEFAIDRGKSVAELYSAEALSFPGADHWDLVLNADVRDAVRRWITSKLRERRPVP
ncbi:MAG: alpha/beta hydrolase [Actinobacteria bacterium]|nr:alpha/beta hydrolase [Actinomycetota bacterium]